MFMSQAERCCFPDDRQVAPRPRVAQRLKWVLTSEKVSNWQAIGLLAYMTMKLETLMRRIGVRGSLFAAKKSSPSVPPVVKDPVRQPNGTFNFTARLAKGTPFVVQASADLENWNPVLNGIATGELTSYADGHAARFNYRFYRLVAGQGQCSNVLGYLSITLPPGFSMIANPLQATTNTVDKVFKDWPDGTTLNKFDTQLFRLAENEVKSSQWTNPSESLMPGEGAIFFNPTSDYRSVCFMGEIPPPDLSIPIPSGFSMCSSPVPHSGSLIEDLEFPIANGDVIHVFDRDKQQYALYPYENGNWTAGAPTLSVGEAFWVAKTEPGTWTRAVPPKDVEPSLQRN
jgi:hypothetical protein